MLAFTNSTRTTCTSSHSRATEQISQLLNLLSKGLHIYISSNRGGCLVRHIRSLGRQLHTARFGHVSNFSTSVTHDWGFFSSALHITSAFRGVVITTLLAKVGLFITKLLLLKLLLLFQPIKIHRCKSTCFQIFRHSTWLLLLLLLLLLTTCLIWLTKYSAIVAIQCTIHSFSHLLGFTK